MDTSKQGVGYCWGFKEEVRWIAQWIRTQTALLWNSDVTTADQECNKETTQFLNYFFLAFWWAKKKRNIKSIFTSLWWPKKMNDSLTVHGLESEKCVKLQFWACWTEACMVKPPPTPRFFFLRSCRTFTDAVVRAYSFCNSEHKKSTEAHAVCLGQMDRYTTRHSFCCSIHLSVNLHCDLFCF